MSKPVVVDKFTYKIMKYLYRHEGTSLDFIKEKFGTKGFQSAARLVGTHLACVYTEDNYSYNYFKNEPMLIYLTIDGNAYVENRRTSTWRWLVTTVISLLALVTSVIAVFIK